MKKRICWITSGYLLQVDLPLLHKVKEYFDIKWVVYASPGSDMAKHAEDYAYKHGLDFTLLYSMRHRYNPMIYSDFVRQMKKLKDYNADIYYFNMIAFPYLIFAIKRYLPADKVVMAMHHGHIHRGMQLRHIYKYYLRFLCNQPFWFQYFSTTQASYFTGNVSHRFVIPLALNDFGKADSVLSQDCVIFLSFGNIIKTKNIGLLIKAACIVKEQCNKPFKVKIVGHCRSWEKYQSLIKYPEIFDLEIKRVPDNEIPNLFSSSHYLVLPYLSVTQSGPLRIAYGYNLPVLTSDLPGFKESVVEGVTGLMFASNDVNALAMLIKKCINEYPSLYERLKNSQKEYAGRNLSVDAVVDQYVTMFNKILRLK
ncbi:uncharacterized protein BN759_01962 [Bacteroides sp. CAG:702]|nr:uncharacterized protein BN759_01962 [Bacteroides sp. CAG:702]